MQHTGAINVDKIVLEDGSTVELETDTLDVDNPLASIAITGPKPSTGAANSCSRPRSSSPRPVRRTATDST